MQYFVRMHLCTVLYIKLWVHFLQRILQSLFWSEVKMFRMNVTEPPAEAVKTRPCQPSPCGSNARCREENNYAVCECEPEYHGNPYEGCRPECLVSSDCAMNKACIRNKCADPCPGTCGVGAVCMVSNHIPICSCPEGTSGDAFRICNYVPVRRKSAKIKVIFL